MPPGGRRPNQTGRPRLGCEPGDPRRGGRSPEMRVRMEETMLETLRQLAKNQRVSPAELVRNAIRLTYMRTKIWSTR